MISNMRTLFVLLAIVFTSNAADWSYVETDPYGPSNWKNMPGSSCDGNSQSPIDIDRETVVPDTSLGEFTFTNYDTTQTTMRLRNNGHTAQVDITGDVKISGARLPGTEFKTEQFHFHWGAEDSKGSEHYIDNTAYPLEMHIVSYNTKYPNLTHAAQQPDGLGVLGLMFVIGANNSAFDNIVNNLDKVQYKGESIQIDAFPLDDLFGTRSRTRYYRYNGSLTTPQCYESVTWTVFAEPKSISTQQLDKFRTLSTGYNNTANNTRLVDNFRPLQQLNNRTVLASQVEWSYRGSRGPANWPVWYETCGKQQQSPVDIKTAQAVHVANLTTIHLGKYKTASKNMTLKNNGHTAQVNLEEDAHQSISGGGLPEGDYQAAQFHFHWGSSDNNGSEHTVDGRMFPLELHIVHFNTKYGSIGSAIARSDGLAVLGFLFSISTQDNPVYDKIFHHLNKTSYRGEKAPIATFPLEELFQSVRQDRYYRYPGSLTTPPCHESVTWTVFADTVAISRAQLAEFRKIYEKKRLEYNNPKMVDNWRPVLPLHGRTVQKSWGPAPIAPPCVGSAKHTSESSASFVLLVALVCYQYLAK